MKKRIVISVLIFLFIVLIVKVYAGTTGKIAGRILDAETGQPLIGANVVIMGTQMGASTDLDGYYTILNVKPGIYTIEISYMGYQSVRVENVKVSVDLTTKVDRSLTMSVAAGEAIVFIAERPMVTKDLTATTASVDAQAIETLPVTELAEVLELQAGYVNGHVRGGRAGEVAYWIDGIPVTDVFNGSTIVDVHKDMVQEMQVVSGAFNAEYGRAMSGIVNIVTKTGSDEFQGGITSYIGDYASKNDHIFPNIDNFNPVSVRNIEGYLQGPIIKNKLYFSLDTRYIHFDGWLYGQRRFNPQNVAYFDSLNNFVLNRDEEGKGDNKYVPLNWNRKVYFQGKLIYRHSANVSITLNTIIDDVISKNSDWAYKYNPDGTAKNFRIGITNILKMTHTLSSNTFYELGLSYYTKKTENYLYENPNDPKYVHPYIASALPYSFLTGGTQNYWYQRKIETFLCKLDLTSQITRNHQIKTGIEFRKHRAFDEGYELRPIEEETDFDFAHDDPFIHTRIMDVNTIYHSTFERKPYEFSAYIQDKMEYGELIINAGIRFDFFDPDGIVLNDPSDPNIYDPIKPQNRYDDLNGNGIQDIGEPDITIEQRRAYWYKNTTSKYKFSPRLGAAFPITDRGVIHFSYGHFFQIPMFERLYQNPDFIIGSGTGNQGVIGNSNLKPEKTISGEIGIQQQISDDISLEITGYFRDVRDLIGTRAEEIVVYGGFAKYSRLMNSDFGFVKGIIFSLNKRFSSGFFSTLDYTYQIAKGTNSNPEEARNALAGGALPEVQMVPLGWDQRHTVNVSVSYNADTWGASLIGQYGSGMPFTPRKTEDISSLLTNSQKKPQTYNVDLRAYKDFKISNYNLQVFLRIFNLLDTLNEYGVFDDTGRANTTMDIQRAKNQNTPEYVNTIDDYYTLPYFYSEPRRIEIGFSFSFKK